MNWVIASITVYGLAWWGTLLYATAQLVTASQKDVYNKRSWLLLPSPLAFFVSKNHSSSWLPKISAECASIALFGALITRAPAVYWPAYGLFFSALIIATITDLDSLVISRFTSLFLAPIGWFCAFYGFIPVSVIASIAGSVFGYGLLYITAYTFSRIMKKQGLGQGDMDLLACIGAFTGIVGAWFSLLIGSLAGSVIGITLLTTKKADRTTLIPFGPFLAVGALIYVLYIFSALPFMWLSQVILQYN